ncbi:RNA polymerase-binding transcription factor DksA [Rickettsiales bacterium]|nr:RNA polymerase-binding transcription factor DksA [Rickettsiales bacterium]
MQNKNIIDSNDRYIPSANEEYMNAEQLEYFKRKLLNLREELLSKVIGTGENSLHEEKISAIDVAEAASQELDVSLELHMQNRCSKTLKEIDYALSRIENGDYGYCEDTGEEIGTKRLEVMPTANLCVKAQEKHDIMHKQSDKKDD